MENVIILIGQRVRSGTNFVASTLFQHPQVITIPPDNSTGELNLFIDRAIKYNVFDKVVNKSSGPEIDDKHIFFQHYGNLWIQLLLNKYKISPNKTVFIKSPFIENWDLWRLAFPNAKIILLSRDGRDNVISSVVAGNDKRSWHSFKIFLKKRINFYLGRTFVSSARHWAKTADIFHEIQENKLLKKFRYEELNNSKEKIHELFKFCELDTEDEIIERSLKAPVVGSSWGVQTKSMAKPNWTPDKDKKKYKFSKKWDKWGVLKRTTFKIIAGKRLVKLGFEADLNW